MEKSVESCEQPNFENTLLLDYLLWDFTWNFENAAVNEHIEHTFQKFKERPEMHFRIEKITDSKFKIEMKRTNFDPKAERDDGYFLEFVLSLLGYRGLPKRQVMDCSTESVSFVYNIRDMKIEPEGSTYWIIKFVIKMHEDTLLQNDACRQQNELILNLAKNTKHQEKLKDMAYLMKRETLTDIFSGRQEFDFAIEKASLIERTLAFADDIANKVRAKENGIEHKTDLPSDAYLQYIFNKNLKFLNECDVLSLYTIAQHYGLPYLVDECVEYMFDLLEANEDKGYIVHILVSACMAYDLKLMNKALDVLNADANAIFLTDSWKNLTGERLIFAQIIDDEARRKADGLISVLLERVDIAKYKKQSKKKNLAVEEPKQSGNLQERGVPDEVVAPCDTTEQESLSEKSLH